MIKFIKPEACYILSYWETFDAICKENIYLAAPEAFPLKSTIEFVQSAIEKNIPMLFAIDPAIDRCIGWCDAMPKTETIGYLGTGLLPAYREQGIGTRLIQEIITLSKAYGYHQIDLDVNSTNHRAIHVYKQLGFSLTGTATEGVLQMTLDL